MAKRVKVYIAFYYQYWQYFLFGSNIRRIKFFFIFKMKEQIRDTK